MNGFDIILGIPLLYAAYRGFREGIIVQLGGIAGLFIGVYFAFRHSSAVGQWLHTDPPFFSKSSANSFSSINNLIICYFLPSLSFSI